MRFCLLLSPTLYRLSFIGVLSKKKAAMINSVAYLGGEQWAGRE
jgi:hypothetical protein